MSDKLKQLNFEFVPIEDRIVMRLSTTGGMGCNFWLTRRFISLFWKALTAGITSQEEVKAQAAPETRQAVMSFQHQGAVQKSDFSQSYEQKGLNYPLGEDAVLLKGLNYKHGENGNLMLSLIMVDDRRLTINLDQRLLHSCAHLLQRVVAKAEWGLTLALPGVGAAPTTQEKAVVH